MNCQHLLHDDDENTAIMASLLTQACALNNLGVTMMMYHDFKGAAQVMNNVVCLFKMIFDQQRQQLEQEKDQQQQQQDHHRYHHRPTRGQEQKHKDTKISRLQELRQWLEPKQKAALSRVSANTRWTQPQQVAVVVQSVECNDFQSIKSVVQDLARESMHTSTTESDCCSQRRTTTQQQQHAPLTGIMIREASTCPFDKDLQNRIAGIVLFNYGLASHFCSRNATAVGDDNDDGDHHDEALSKSNQDEPQESHKPSNSVLESQTFKIMNASYSIFSERLLKSAETDDGRLVEDILYTTLVLSSTMMILQDQGQHEAAGEMTPVLRQLSLELEEHAPYMALGDDDGGNTMSSIRTAAAA